MRFFLDHDVDAAVAKTLRQDGHEAWTAGDAGLSDARDDVLTVYVSNRGAVLVTHDREFSQRRRRNVVGRHLWLQCNEWDAAGLLTQHLPEIITVLESSPDVFLLVSKGRFEIARNWS